MKREERSRIVPCAWCGEPTLVRPCSDTRNSDECDMPCWGVCCSDDHRWLWLARGNPDVQDWADSAVLRVVS